LASENDRKKPEKSCFLPEKSGFLPIFAFADYFESHSPSANLRADSSTLAANSFEQES
jgi:hypothetical protein